MNVISASRSLCTIDGGNKQEEILTQYSYGNLKKNVDADMSLFLSLSLP